MDIINLLSWLKAGKFSKTVPEDALSVIAVPNITRGDAYLPVTVPTLVLSNNIGKRLGGGIVVDEWDENGVKKFLIASLTNLSNSLPWTVPAYISTFLGGTSKVDGLPNTDAIIAQTGAPAATTYAAGIARLYLGGGYNDWYLPSNHETFAMMRAAFIVNRNLSVTQTLSTTGGYATSTELNGNSFYGINNTTLGSATIAKSTLNPVRAVRIHTL
jgi:hypothetical protein